jgi:hypothetical protein
MHCRLCINCYGAASERVWRGLLYPPPSWFHNNLCKDDSILFSRFLNHVCTLFYHRAGITEPGQIEIVSPEAASSSSSGPTDLAAIAVSRLRRKPSSKSKWAETAGGIIGSGTRKPAADAIVREAVNKMRGFKGDQIGPENNYEGAKKWKTRKISNQMSWTGREDGEEGGKLEGGDGQKRRKKKKKARKDKSKGLVRRTWKGGYM